MKLSLFLVCIAASFALAAPAADVKRLAMAEGVVGLAGVAEERSVKPADAIKRRLNPVDVIKGRQVNPVDAIKRQIKAPDATKRQDKTEGILTRRLQPKAPLAGKF